MTLLTEIYNLPLESGSDEEMLTAQIEDLTKKLEAAKRGLQLANQLRGLDKKKHQSRVLGNLNRIRSRLNAVIRQVEQNSNSPEI
jgi:hypothetical protein